MSEPPRFDDLDLEAYADVPYEIEFVDGPPRGEVLYEDHRIETVQVTVHTNICDDHGKTTSKLPPHTLTYKVFPHAVGYTDSKGIVCVYAYGATDDDACQRHIDALRLRQEADFLDALNSADVAQAQ